MKLQDIKAGDRITVRGTGYLSNYVRRYIVKRITDTRIIARIDSPIAVVDTKFRRSDGCRLPLDRHLNWYIETD